jgi:anti-sigma factor RsiW
LNGHSVAALVFQPRKHVINLFIWPVNEKNSKPAVFGSIQGYNVIHWTNAGMTFWAASDLNKNGLMKSVQDYDDDETVSP